jgi:putative DNA primase/helicase
MSGKWERVDRKGSVSAKLFDDGLAGIVYDWRTGEKFYWFSDQNKISSSEYERRRADCEAREAKTNTDYAKVAKYAEKLFTEAPMASQDHPYLARKQVKPYGIKAQDGYLLIPVYSVLGDFQSIQFIDANGSKKFLKGGQMQGGCHFIGEIRAHKPIYIAEGYATAASVYEDTQCLTIVAFNAGNLIKVATELRRLLPEIRIVIAGDSDAVGKEYAEKTAKAVNGSIVIPDFGENPQGFTDWNDYFTHEVAA